MSVTRSGNGLAGDSRAVDRVSSAAMNGKVTRLLLIRHAETDWNRDGRFQGHADVPLNGAGREQARRLARRLAGEVLAAVYSSDLLRARQTAEHVAQAAQVPLRMRPALREADLGAWSGLTRDEIVRQFPDEWDGWVSGVDGARTAAESYAAVQARAVRAVDEIVASHAGESVAVVSHGGTLKAIICHVLGLGLEHMPAFSAGMNTAISVIEYPVGHGERDPLAPRDRGRRGKLI